MFWHSIWCDSEGSSDYFHLWDIWKNADYIFKIIIATVQQRWVY